MVVHIAHQVAIDACNNINAKIDAGSGPGKLIIYSGTRPAQANAAPSGATVLVTFILGDPAFAAAATVGNNATASANSVSPVQAVANGTASFFRIVDSDDNPVLDGSVTDTSGNGDLKLSTTAIVTGIDVSVVSLTASMPEGQ
ncbi:hypothetical protein EVB87_282 [Rhizobium phage RHph_N28_1]|nr:hypothetical protein EVB87_282 [Rhizobium phage RHph_N28_1]QIG74310.1 hypothetical protein EVC07_282 [Rhizobium phage RHph_N42]QIG74919.1 hypothetical protein EVC12_284 [Rhizobium phage RHph_I42]QXV73969.1 hypothetical protein [Rhizobium phage RHph_N46]